MGDCKPQSSPRSRLSRWVLNAGLIVLSIVAVTILLETALRFTSHRYLLTRDRLLRYYYRFDPVKGFDIKPNVKGIMQSVDKRIEYRIWSNELGCFDTPYPGDQPFILLVGDSFTHIFAPFPDKWGTQMEKLLHHRVLKCGVSGYGTGQELAKAREIIGKVHRRPELIVVGYFFNDISDDSSFPNLTVIDGFLVPSLPYKDPQTGKLLGEKLTKTYTLREKLFSGDYPLSWGDMIRYSLARRLIIMNLINDAIGRLFPGNKYAYTDPRTFLAFEDETKHWSIWARHLQNLSGFKELAAANQANLLVVLIPTNTQVYPFLAGDHGLDLERPNKVVGRFLKAQGIDYVDLLPPMRARADATPRRALNPDRDLYWRHNSHWSIRGEHLAGLLVSQYILEHRLVQVEDREAKLKNIEARLAEFGP